MWYLFYIFYIKRHETFKGMNDMELLLIYSSKKNFSLLINERKNSRLLLKKSEILRHQAANCKAEMIMLLEL